MVAWMKQPTAGKLALETGTLACDGVSGGIFLVLAPLGLISTAFWMASACYPSHKRLTPIARLRLGQCSGDFCF